MMRALRARKPVEIELAVAGYFRTIEQQAGTEFLFRLGTKAKARTARAVRAVVERLLVDKFATGHKRTDKPAAKMSSFHAFQDVSTACAHSFITVSARSTVGAPSTNGLGPAPAAAASFSIEPS